MDVFLSDRIYWIWWIFFSFSQFPDETEKGGSRYAGEINPSCCVAGSVLLLISGLTLELSFAALGGMVFLSFSPGRTKEKKYHVNPVYPVYCIKEYNVEFIS